MVRVLRDVPFPADMQGRWLIAEEPGSELIVDGAEIICFGQRIEYDYKDISEVEGALTVELGIIDAAKDDAFQRANIVGLVITPEGEFMGWNNKFGIQFVRPDG